jgi:hypothetical protein
VINYGDCDEPDAKPLKLDNTYKFYPLMIRVSPEIADLMKSNEAKAYLKDIERECIKLKAFFDRNCKGVAAYLPGEADDDHESTRFRHKVLHQAFDELFACYITEHPEQHGFLKTELGDFMEWSANMTLEATCEQQD